MYFSVLHEIKNSHDPRTMYNVATLLFEINKKLVEIESLQIHESGYNKDSYYMLHNLICNNTRYIEILQQQADYELDMDYYIHG